MYLVVRSSYDSQSHTLDHQLCVTRVLYSPAGTIQPIENWAVVLFHKVPVSVPMYWYSTVFPCVHSCYTVVPVL
eukprot:COSAG02_NODE_1548_length_11970_cov_43.634235_8_plen_74_part_00